MCAYCGTILEWDDTLTLQVIDLDQIPPPERNLVERLQRQIRSEPFKPADAAAKDIEDSLSDVEKSRREVMQVDQERVTAAVNELRETVDERTSPGKMNKREAMLVLEDLHSHIGGMIDGLEDDLAEEIAAASIR